MDRSEYFECHQCGKSCLKKDRFTVYDKDFCSKDCLRPFKQAEDDKRKPKVSKDKVVHMNYGGGGACC